MKGLTTTTKALYGLGFSSRGIKDGLFQIFLFFYFNQVLGLDAAFAGTASLVALVFDAVSDPLVGLWSDKLKMGKWGRRHPFMIASAFPLGIFTYLLFAPPSGVGQTGLFLWMLSFSVLVRLALTFFIVPHMSLGAELTTDYKERTTVTAYRIMFAAFISPVVMIIGYLVYFPENKGGLYHTEGYPAFALLCAILMILAIIICVWGTRNVIPQLPRPSAAQESMSFFELMGSLKEAVKLTSFRSLALFIMMIYIGIGVGVVFSTYFGEHYFDLTTPEMAALPIGSALGGILALIVAPGLGEKLEKKGAAIWSTVIFSFFFSLPFNLRMLGIFPENGAPSLLPIYVVTLIIAYMFLWVTFSLANSMMADVIDEYEYKYGKRQEGLFFAAVSFAFKCTTGLGQFIAGILLTCISFPSKEELTQHGISAEAVSGLGLVGGIVLLAFYLLAILFILAYPIDKSRYLEIRAELEKAQT